MLLALAVGKKNGILHLIYLQLWRIIKLLLKAILLTI